MPAKRRRQGAAQPSPLIQRAPNLPLGARLRAYLLAGVLVTAPISFTLYLAWLFIDFIDDRVAALLPSRLDPDSIMPFGVPGAGVIIVIIFLILVGWLAAGYVGRILLRTSENVVARIPAVRSVYGAVKQILETVLAQQSSAFREVVLIEYPRRGVWAVGFISGTTKGQVQEATSETLVNVFLPTTPNPTSGFLLFLPKRDVIHLDMTVEEGIKLVVSAGIVTPPSRRAEAPAIAAPPAAGETEPAAAPAPPRQPVSAGSGGARRP